MLTLLFGVLAVFLPINPSLCAATWYTRPYNGTAGYGNSDGT